MQEIKENVVDNPKQEVIVETNIEKQNATNEVKQETSQLSYINVIPNKKNSTLYITYLNILSCFAVVALHANGTFWSFSKSLTWISANFLECLFYFAVPIFFMCSGATLLNYRERYSTKQFFVKRIKKTVVPYLIWSAFAIFFGYFIIKSIPYEMVTGVRYYINTLFDGIGIYWFFIPLFAFYLCVPLLSLISPNDDDKQKKVLKYIIITGFIINMVLPLLCNLLNLHYNGASSIVVVSGYILYGITGFYINKYNIDKNWRIIFYILGILGFCAHFFGTWALSYKIDAIDGLLKGYLNVPCFLFSMAIFLLFKNINFEKLGKTFNSFIKWIAPTTFGVFLIHDYFLQFLRITSINVYSIWFRTLGAVAIFVVCVVIIKLVQLIPKVGKTIFP